MTLVKESRDSAFVPPPPPAEDIVDSPPTISPMSTRDAPKRHGSRRLRQSLKGLLDLFGRHHRSNLTSDLDRELANPAPGTSGSSTHTSFPDAGFAEDFGRDALSPSDETTNAPSGALQRRARKAPAAPTRVALGWIDSPNHSDAIEAAKHYAQNHFDAPAISFYYVKKYQDGYFWEAQQGGPGRAYLPNILTALEEERQPVWFRVRDRAYTISLRDHRPYFLLQPTEQSKAYFAYESCEVHPSSTRMNQIVWRGSSALIAGIILCTTGMISFFFSTQFAGHQRLAMPLPHRHDIATLPFDQWKAVSQIPLNRYVEAHRFANGHWQQPILRTIDKYRALPVEKLELDDLASPTTDDKGPNAAATPSTPPLPPVRPPATRLLPASSTQPHNLLAPTTAKPTPQPPIRAPQ